MLASVHSGAVYGVDAYAVEIEVNTRRGALQTGIVGLPDAAVAGGHNLLMIGPPGNAFICNVGLWREAA